MSKADVIFKNMCKDILTNGTDTRGQKVRPVWQDTGEKAYTIKKFGVVNTYDLREEFPAITLRKTAIKSAMDEILWIYQRKSNKIKDLNSHIWDEWQDANGTIGLAYGYQIGKHYIHHTVDLSKISCEDWIEMKNQLMRNYPSVLFSPIDSTEGMDSSKHTWNEIIEKIGKCEDPNERDTIIFNHLRDIGKTIVNIKMDQIDSVIYDLRTSPFSRRIMTNMWNFEDLHRMNLQPCCYSCTFNVTEENGELILNMVSNQRSQDVLAANNWNVVQYALLQMMIAQVCDMKAGKLVHVIADAHIYDRHVDSIKKLLDRKEYPAPIVTLDPTIKNFYSFTIDSITIENYTYGEQITNIPIAV